MGKGGWGGGDILIKSPLHLTARLQPACFASAWSMWSRKPIPVEIVICWVEVNCVACGASGFGDMAFEVLGKWEDSS